METSAELTRNSTESVLESHRSEGQYTAFIGHLRLAELAPPEERPQLADEAAQNLVGLCAPGEQEWGQILVTRLAAGEDISIAKPLVDGVRPQWRHSANSR
jgi:hypothetical protein